MSILFLSSFEKLHETALSMKIGTKSTLNRHQVDELVARTGTKSGPSWDHVGTKLGLSRDQVGGQSPTQLYKTPFSEQVIRSVTTQVTEHVAPTNHRGHGDFTAEVESTAIVAAKVTTSRRGSKT